MGTVGVLGGDERQVYLAKRLQEKGEKVFLCGLENCKGAEGMPELPLREFAKACESVFFPLPATKDGILLHAPFSREVFSLDDRFARLFENKRVYGGMMEKLVSTSTLWKNIKIYDYYTREELTVGNAFLTAEGAVGLAVCHGKGALNGSRCLVTGFGRIGKALCLALKALGAKVDCCARKPQDLAAIEAIGCEPLEYQQISRCYDAVFNTVPAQVLGVRELALQSPETFLLELASPPGGICRKAAEDLGFSVTDGQGLPGRFSPKTSAKMILDAACRMRAEEEWGREGQRPADFSERKV